MPQLNQLSLLFNGFLKLFARVNPTTISVQKGQVSSYTEILIKEIEVKNEKREKKEKQTEKKMKMKNMKSISRRRKIHLTCSEKFLRICFANSSFSRVVFFY